MKTLVLIVCGYLIIPSIMAQEDSFSFEEIKGNGENITVMPQEKLSYDATKINYYRFTPEKAAIAKLIFIHGGGAHSKLGYFQLAQTLKDSFSVEAILIDLRGHGLSEGERGDAPSPKSLYKDISLFVQMARQENKQPVYLGGHSSGGGLLLNYVSWKKKEKVDGLFFISPEFGYKSNTEREDRVPFAEVKVSKFVINGMTQGLLMQHSDAVFFNYPEKVLIENPLILTAITVNMSKALTPKNPQKQFQKITDPIALFIGEDDELFESEKVIDYINYPTLKNNKTVSKLIPSETHLSILNNIGIEIGQTILQWNKLKHLDNE